MESISNVYFTISPEKQVFMVIDTGTGGNPFLIFNSVELFGYFIEDCAEFLKMCRDDDIPPTFRDAFKEDNDVKR